MQASHIFALNSSPAFLALEALLIQRWATSDALGNQPVFERELHSAVLRLGAEVMAADLARMDVRVDGIRVDGEAYRPKHSAKGEYMTLLGPVVVDRMVYESRGGHGEKRCVPLEMRLGFMDGHWTPVAAEVGCRFMASTASREAASLLGEVSAMQPSPCHLDRLSKHFNEHWEPARIELEAELRTLEKLPDVSDVALIQVSLDGVMLPMKEAPRETQSDAQGCGSQGYKEVGSATFCLFNDQGERIHTIRLGRMPESRKVTLKAQMAEELKRLTGRYAEARLVSVADGAKENWRILNELGSELGCKMTFVLDFFHAMEHISVALNQTFTGAPQAKEAEISRWRHVLLEEEGGVVKLAAELQEQKKRLRGKKRVELSRELNYLLKHQNMMKYAEFRSRGLPIGSGIQEAACKTLVSQRMKRSGMSWRATGGQSILTLRSLEQSGRQRLAWDVLRPRLQQPYTIDEAPARKRPNYMAL